MEKFSFKVGLGLILLFPLNIALAEKQPKLVIESAVHNFGTVSEGTKVVHDFNIKNNGDGDLLIQRIVPSCGCTAISSSAEKLSPGTNATIHVEVDTSGFSGEKLKTVRLFTNDPTDSAAILTMRGTIEADVTVEPTKLVFPELVKGETTQAPYQDFQINVRPGSKIQLKELTSYARYVTIKELESTDKHKKVRVTLNLDIPSGEYRDRVVASLAGGNISNINIPIIATVKGKLELKPASLSFGIIEGNSPLIKVAKVQNLSDLPINLKHIASDNPAVTAQFDVVKPGKMFNIQIKVDPKKVNSDLRASITVTTDNKEEEQLTLPVYGITPPKS